MSINVDWDGTTYTVPQKGEKKWSTQVTSQLQNLLAVQDGASAILNGVPQHLYRATSTSLAAGATLTQTHPVHLIQGTPGAVTLGLTTAIADGSRDGVMLTLIGSHVTNIVTIPNNANTKLRSDIVLRNGESLTLRWNSATGDWQEIQDSNFHAFTAFKNVKDDYGAVGDGSTDDTTAIQNAINSLAATGGVVWFPPVAASYKVTAKLTIPKHVILRGSGAGETVSSRIRSFQTNADPLFEVKDGASFTEWVTFEDLELYGNGSSHTGNAIRFYGPLHCFVNRCGIYNFGGIGVSTELAGSTNQHVNISNSHIYFNVKGGVKFDSGFDCAIRNCMINQNGFYGVYLKSQVNTMIDSCEFAAYFYGNTPAGGAHQAVPVALNSDQHTNIVNCRWENNGGQSGTPGYNVRTAWDGDAQSDTTNTTRNLICFEDDFSGSLANGRDLTHVRLHFIKNATFIGCHFEWGGFTGTYNGIEFATLVADGKIIRLANEFGSGLTTRTTGASPPLLSTDDLNSPLTSGVDATYDRTKIFQAEGGRYETVCKSLLHTVTAGPTNDLESFFPLGVTVEGVTGRVVTTIGGATTLDIGATAQPAIWADEVAVAAGSTFDPSKSTLTSPQIIKSSQTTLRLTANGSNFDGTGTIRIVAWYKVLTAPTS